MKKNFTVVEFLIVIAIIFLLFGTTVMPFINAKMESNTYNRLTGAHTTWWDAMWVELRIQDTPKIEVPQKAKFETEVESSLKMNFIPKLEEK